MVLKGIRLFSHLFLAIGTCGYIAAIVCLVNLNKPWPASRLVSQDVRAMVDSRVESIEPLLVPGEFKVQVRFEKQPNKYLIYSGVRQLKVTVGERLAAEQTIGKLENMGNVTGIMWVQYFVDDHAVPAPPELQPISHAELIFHKFCISCHVPTAIRELPGGKFTHGEAVNYVTFSQALDTPSYHKPEVAQQLRDWMSEDEKKLVINYVLGFLN